MTNENAQLARVCHQTARQTAESIAGTELGPSVASVSDADSRLGHPGCDDGVNPKSKPAFSFFAQHVQQAAAPNSNKFSYLSAILTH